MSAFSPFIELQKDVRSRYGLLVDEFPYSAAVLNMSIRQVLAGQEKDARRCLGRIGKKKMLNRMYLKYCESLSRLGPFNKEIILSLGDRFPGLEALLDEVYYDVGYSVSRSGSKNPSRNIDYFLLEKVSLFRLCFHSSGVSRSIDAFLRKESIAKALSDRCLWLCLEESLEAESTRIRGVLKNLKVQLLVSGGDFMPEARWLTLLLREIGARHFVFAHAYLARPDGLNTLPIVADKLFVWTATQRDEIKKVLPQGERNKVVFAGWPKLNRLSGSCDRVNGALLVLEKIRPHPYPDLKEGVFEIIRRMQKTFDAFSVRPHPDDEEQPEIVSAVSSGGGRFACGDLYEELDAAELVIGTNSSCLVEAGRLGLPVVQIEEFARVDCEPTLRLSISELSEARVLYGSRERTLTTEEMAASFRRSATEHLLDL